MTRHIGAAERRARLARRHGLAEPHDSVTDLAGSIVGLHSTDPATVFLTPAARHVADSPEAVDTELYDDRTLVRHLGMRRTLFTHALDVVDAVQSGYTDQLLMKERRNAAGWFEDSGLCDDGQRHIDELSNRTLAHLVEHGPMTTRDLNEQVPGLDESFLPPGNPSYTRAQSVGGRILFLMATAGLIVRGRPLGGWTSGLNTWATTEQWIGRPLESLEPGAARVTVIERWLRAFGPGTMTDVKWWTGSTVRDTKAALERIGAVEVTVDEGDAFVLADDVDEVEPVAPTARLLPGLDPTTMGWKERDWYLGGHGDDLFDRNGNGGPTVWWDGRIVGGWAQREDGEVAVEFLEDVTAECRDAVATEAEHLRTWIGDVRVKPRFRTPLEKRLVG